ncbi:MAG: Gx transporter family protein [Oscillospiraceae bacterium]|jgi:heptaprenyl diphosphate synthase|nr:Gx transporter family protein [Oscillospiraceae bacterium]
MSLSKRVAAYGILISLTLALSYAESLLPVNLAVPGVKLGLANIGVLVALYILGDRAGVVISLIRAVVMGLLFSGVTAMLYSLAGALFSITGMALLKRTNLFGIAGVSVAGAALHIAGQALVSRWLLGSWAVLAYMPLLLGVSCITGVFNGAAAGMTVKYAGKARNKNR